MNEADQIRMGRVPCTMVGISDFVAYIRFALMQSARGCRVLSFINAHVYNLAMEDDELLRMLLACDCVVADGMSIVWGARIFGGHIPGRCNMTEAFRAFLASDAMPSSTALLLGGEADVAKAAAAAIHQHSRHCRVTAAYSGFLDDEAYCRLLGEHANVDLVLIGMGTPRSEHIAFLAAKICARSVIWHIGGGTVMFLAGRLEEAPCWMRRSGLQWLHRLMLEPRRMWHRYVIGNPKFIWYIACAKLKAIFSNY